jgi:hypothetical protein
MMQPTFDKNTMTQSDREGCLRKHIVHGAQDPKSQNSATSQLLTLRIILKTFCHQRKSISYLKYIKDSCYKMNIFIKNRPAENEMCQYWCIYCNCSYSYGLTGYEPMTYAETKQNS